MPHPFHLITVDPSTGSDVGTFCQSLAEMAEKYNCRVRGVFNGRMFTAEASWADQIYSEHGPKEIDTK